jgi:DNA-binding NarL/FixJ family response regulator
MTVTRALSRAPELTRREQAVLEALCRPVAFGDMFTEPASVRQMAVALRVTETAVKYHLGNLYVKFGIADEGDRRRVRLANEAIRRGAVALSAMISGDHAPAGAAEAAHEGDTGRAGGAGGAH